MGWKEMLRAELAALPEAERIIAVGEAINDCRNMSAELGVERRELAVYIIETGMMDYPTLAAEVGMRVQTVRRLVEEGRRQRKEASVLSE